MCDAMSAQAARRDRGARGRRSASVRVALRLLTAGLACSVVGSGAWGQGALEGGAFGGTGFEGSAFEGRAGPVHPSQWAGAALEAQGLAATDVAVVPIESARGRTVRLAAIDSRAFAAVEVESQRAGRPLRFAIPAPADLSPAAHGVVTPIGDGRVEWTLDIDAPGARSLNFGTRFDVPAGVTLYLLDGAGRMVGEPYTASDATMGELWTRLVPGPFAQLVAEMPAERFAGFAAGFGITSINAGFLDVVPVPADVDADPDAAVAVDDAEGGADPLGSGFVSPESFAFELRSAACHVDVECPEAAPFQSQIDSVARIVIGGSGVCSGVMVNNVRGDQTPYFLTAHHCGAWANPGSVIFYWNYQHSTCRPPGSTASGANGNGSLAQNQSGSVLRLTNAEADLTLLELSQLPNPVWNVEWAGVDATINVDSPGAFAIHHPSGEEKRISFEDNPLNAIISGLPGQPNIRVWQTQFDLGGIQPGSSGGPLFDSGGRVIGVGTGVDTTVACFPQQTVFGRVNYAWNIAGQTGGPLRTWLDPDDTGQSVIDPLFGDLSGPGPFALQSPADGETAVSVTPTLSWSVSPIATSYELRIDDDPNTAFDPVLVENLTGTSFAVPAGLLAQETTYYWSVRAFNVFGQADATPGTGSFTTLVDCDGNEVDDLFEIAEGLAEDCNNNGVLDSCDVTPDPFGETSPQLNPIGTNNHQTYTFVQPPSAGGDVTLSFRAEADINSPLENITVSLNGVEIGQVFEEPSGTFFDCIELAEDELIVSAASWNSFASLNGGDVEVFMFASSSINAAACGGDNFIGVSASYETPAGSAPLDLDGNGIVDSCEGGCSPADITDNGTCQPGTQEGVVTLSDFSCYLSLWSAGDPLADITPTGTCMPGMGGDGVDLSDFSCYLATWSAGCP